MLLIRMGGSMPDIDAMFVLVPAFVIAIFAAYYAMKYTAMKRYAREEAEARAERKRGGS